MEAVDDSERKRRKKEKKDKKRAKKEKKLEQVQESDGEIVGKKRRMRKTNELSQEDLGDKR
jgi:hypothetical protein